MKKILLLASVSFILITASFASLAGGKASYKISKKSLILNLYYQDDDHIRMDLLLDGEPLNSLLKLKNKSYFITPQFVLDTAIVRKGSTERIAKRIHKNMTATKDSLSFKATGKFKTIAGIKGEIYDVRVNNRTFHPVLTNNTQLLSIQKGWEPLIAEMVLPIASQTWGELNKINRSKQLTMLSDGGNIELISFEEKKLDAKLFMLPKDRTNGIPGLSEILTAKRKSRVACPRAG